MTGIPEKVLFEAIDQSREARLVVIDEMEKCMSESRAQTSKYAPKVKQIKINPEKIGELIGPGGKVIRGITDKTGVEISIDEDNSGNVVIYSNSEEAYNEAINMINLALGDIEEGAEYDAKVVRIEAFGAFVEIPNTRIQGMIHVSNLGLGYVKDIKDVVKLGETMRVKYMGRDEKGRTKFVRVKEEGSEIKEDQAKPESNNE
jgi:polyribonucleotide nucleotidyltransferase